MGRHKKVTREELIEGVSDYIKNTKIPIVTEYAHLNGITKQHLYLLAKDDEELSDALKRIVEEKEIVLEKGALTGAFNPTMAIFSLKQLGWKDKVEIGNDERKNFTISFSSGEEYGV